MLNARLIVNKQYTISDSPTSGLLSSNGGYNSAGLAGYSDHGILDQDPADGTIADPISVGQLVVGTPNTGLFK